LIVSFRVKEKGPGIVKEKRKGKIIEFYRIISDPNLETDNVEI
jgi:hypothetical protein